MTTEEAVLTQEPVVEVPDIDIVKNEAHWYERMSVQLEAVGNTSFYPQDIMDAVAIFENPTDFKTFAMSIADENLHKLKQRYNSGRSTYKNKYNSSLNKLAKAPSIVPKTINYI